MGTPRPGRRDQRSLRLFFALVAIVYLAVYPYLQAINNPNENTRVYLVMALVDEGTFQLDGVVRRYGWTNDMAKVPDARAPGGSHLASVKGPFMSYLGLPVYGAQKLVLRLFGRRPPGPEAPPADASAWLRTTTLTLQLFCVHVPCFLFLVWFERRLRRWSRDIVLRLSAVAAVGLGTNYLAYSFVFVSHAWSAAAVFIALELVAEARLRARGRVDSASPALALQAGLFAGFVTLLEYQGFFVSIVIAVAALSIFRKPRALASFAAGASPSVLLLLLFQWRSFGHPLTPGHRMMQTEAFRALQNQGLFGITRPSPEAALSLLFDGGYGLFGTSPYLWLALLGVTLGLARSGGAGRVLRERRLSLLAPLAAFLVLLLSVSAAVIWRGGWTIGPRYLGAAPPLVGLLALAGLERLARLGPRARPLVRALALGLAIASFVQGGAIGLVVSTLPEAILRPVPQVLLPLVRLRLLPHHALEFLGIASAFAWWIAPLAACAALLVPIWLRAGDSRRALAARMALAAVVGVVALMPAFRMPAGGRDDGAEVRGLFYEKWEPAGRDLLSLAHRRAAADPCAFAEVARWETLLGRTREAAASQARAASCGVPR